MKITVDLPDRLTEKIADFWQDVPGKVVNTLLVSAFRDRLISFEELWEMLALKSDREKRLFLQREQVLHTGGLLNLYGTCANLSIEVDDAGIDSNCIFIMNDEPQTNDDEYLRSIPGMMESIQATPNL